MKLNCIIEHEICIGTWRWQNGRVYPKVSGLAACSENSAPKCSYIAILWVSLVCFAAITLYVASQQVFVVVSVNFVIDSVRKLLDTPSYQVGFHVEMSVWRIVKFLERLPKLNRRNDHINLVPNFITNPYKWRISYSNKRRKRENLVSKLGASVFCWDHPKQTSKYHEIWSITQ
jgi:hypothetical protein